MESNLFIKYLNKKETQAKKDYRGPVITISREYGCYATQVAQKLKQLIQEETRNNNWQYITKEILTEAAESLDVKQEEIAHLFGAEEKSFLGDLVVSFGRKKYASDDLIRKTIRKVVRNYSETGCSIIVGRAGCIIAKDLHHSLHVKLMASKKWRIESIAQRHELLKNEAEKLVDENDARREKFLNFFSENTSNTELFDAIYNRGTLNTDQIAKSIFNLAKEKNLFTK